MLSTMSPSSAARSSLEEMLDSLRRRDDTEKPKNLPPSLPARPTSRARLPSVRKSLPDNFKVADSATDCSSHDSESKEDANRKTTRANELVYRVGSFGSKKVKGVEPGELPYVVSTEESESRRSCEETGSDLAAATCSSPLKFPESDWNDNIGYFTKKKLSVWCQLPTGLWNLGKIQSVGIGNASVLLSGGNVVNVSTGDLLPANPDILDGVDDLTQLSYLNEPSVLHNLQYRYTHDIIYSKAGPVLIAINPFKDVPIIGNDLITDYNQKLRSDPHVYAIADASYAEMMRGEGNQSIIISGESGSGKTETAKIAMQYLASLGDGSGGLEQEILLTSYILEAFGNAKTSRNNNSSRFGKLIEIHFSSLGKICGAKIQTFLLEKSRVVQLANGERSYHVFYQLCAGAPFYLREKLNLKVANEYLYLNQSNCLVIDDIDDAHKFQMLVEALDVVGICKEDQERVFEMLAAILWLGNIKFHVSNSENLVEVVVDDALTSAARLMGCNHQDLVVTLSMRKIQAGRDSIAKRLTLWQAADRRNALAKFIYANLFDWLVEQINKSLEIRKWLTGKSISILDIYGFESFENNSFEQFCINYANERLQQHFNRHLFKLEQEEYDMDGIDWTKVDFDDNQECLDLVEKKPLGILSLLDEESNFPKATDLTFANKLKQHLNANSCFESQRVGAFSIQHYAGEVVYETCGFLEKNRDSLHHDCTKLLLSSTCKLVQSFVFQKHESPPGQVVPLDSHKQSVGTRFKDQLFKLMRHLEYTAPHFIRCIKPNSKKLPCMYDPEFVLQQLKCCGVLEVVKISKSGYPTRITHQEFSRRYGFLLEEKENNVSQDPLSMSIAVLKQFNVLPDMYQVGFTKLFLRTGQIGSLEHQSKLFLEGVIGIQKCLRAQQARCFFLELRRGVIMLQSFVRGENARKEFYQMVERWRFDCLIKKQIEEKQTLENKQKAILHVQSVIRGWLVRRSIDSLRNQKLISIENGDSLLKPDGKYIDAKGIIPPGVGELQRQVEMTEKILEQKEEENGALRDQLEQLKTRWCEHELKTITTEELLKRQIASLQTSLAEAKKRELPSDNNALRKPDDSLSPQYMYSDNNSIGSRTPGGNLSFVGHLVREFDQQKQVFDEDAKSLSGNGVFGMNPDEEFRKLKDRFEAWKKDYKARLREMKGKLSGEKRRRNWWGKRMRT